jgi:preprotein translocase subunit SecD
MIQKNEVIAGMRQREVIAIFAFAFLACAAMFLDKAQGVPIYVASMVLISIVATFIKRDSIRIAALLAIVFLSAFSIASNGVKFGIDFSGGVRIPVLLEQSVDAGTMENMVKTIKTRAASFGLSEVKVRPIGDSEIYVELPQSSPQLVSDVEKLLSRQGVYRGIVDGQVAVKGEEIYTGTIMKIPSQYLQGADWGVSFTVTQTGAQRFATTAKGKANYPLFMFLDRPTDSIIIITEKQLMEDAAAKSRVVPVSKPRALQLALSSLALEGDNITLYLEENVAKNFSLSPATNKTRAIVTANSSLIAKLQQAGFIVVEKTEAEMTPKYMTSPDNPASDAVTTWTAVGLLSAPRLVPSVTDGIPNFSYTINGPAEGSTASLRAQDALKKERELESLLKGGALPVQISVGSKTIIPAPLGEEFLRLSLIGIAFSLLAIALMVALRYRHLQIVLPMLFISAAELVILLAILGSFTIDLAGMAGILAAIGVGVDAQIIVTDELLKKNEGDMKKRLEKAFSIITTSVTVAVVAMVPLLFFSGLVEIIGFATATVLGSLLGLFISRPAYAVIAEHLFE